MRVGSPKASSGPGEMQFSRHAFPPPAQADSTAKKFGLKHIPKIKSAFCAQKCSVPRAEGASGALHPSAEFQS